MKQFFLDYAKQFDIESISYDVPTLVYHNPRNKGRPEPKTLEEMGFPYDIKKAPLYYNSDMVHEFVDKTRAHWRRKLPEFKDLYLQYLLAFNSREVALEKFFSDSEPYGVSKEEAENYLKSRMLYYLEPQNAFEVLKELIYLILEYAPKSFDYLINCYGLAGRTEYWKLYDVAIEILGTKLNVYELAPKVVKREVIKGTPLIDIYKNFFENKSAIKDAVKSMTYQDYEKSPVSWYERKLERILLSQSNLDYKVNETIDGIKLNYSLYDDGAFLFGIIFDGEVLSGDYTADSLAELDAHLETIQSFDRECLNKGVAIYHVTYLSLDEFDIDTTDDIRSARKDITYLYDIINDNKQYSRLRDYLLEEIEDNEDDYDDDEDYDF